MGACGTGRAGLVFFPWQVGKDRTKVPADHEAVLAFEWGDVEGPPSG